MTDNQATITDKSAQADPKAKRERSSLTKILPTDRISFDRQVEILKAFSACYESNGGKPVTPDQAGDALTPKFSGSTIGVAVPFFVDAGLLTRADTGFAPIRELVEYNRAFDFSPAEAKRKIRPVVESAWFSKLLGPRLRLAPQNFEDCVGVLAIEATAEKEHLERVRPLIKFLEWAGIVNISGNSVSYLPVVGESMVRGDPNSPIRVPEKFSEMPKYNEASLPDDYQENFLFLDAAKQKKVTLQCPLKLTKQEYDRIIKWIDATWIIDGPKSE